MDLHLQAVHSFNTEGTLNEFKYHISWFNLTLPRHHFCFFYQSHYPVHFVTNFRPTLNAPYLQLLISNKNNVPPKMN